ncbi:hypothetical protein [Legionella maceachernii]|uniref:hypothetical protein n=1 Tax=Legionella maceachernii TaxID=466 RepID=UPI001F303425|nr:hypothetical protein [Legionella maceachernii]
MTEPRSSRYLYINPNNNRVHLRVPFIAGQNISTDNTCKSNVELKAFFEDGAAYEELESYKSALEFDMSLLEEGTSLRQVKEERLAQINTYMEAVIAMRDSYGQSVIHFLTKPSNLYSIQLRPRVQDPYSVVVNPVFNVNRRNDGAGNPLSPLYNSMHRIFPEVTLARPDPRTQLIGCVLIALPEGAAFQDILRVLKEQCQTLFGIEIDVQNYFKRTLDGTVKQEINQAHINALMGFGGDATAKDYIEALLGVCAPDLSTLLQGSPFYLGTYTKKEEKAERLSILTQFYLGVMNVYCRAQGISDKNFGMILDASPQLSQELVETVSQALSAGDDVEEALCVFFNLHASKFGLSHSLSAEDKDAIQQKFETGFRTVTATKENPHMDDFMILDLDARGENAKFITHQGLICTDFANIVDPTCANQKYFEQIRKDAAIHPEVITPKNESVITEVDIEPEVLLDKLSDVQWERLPKEAKEACQALPGFQVRQILDDVAKGKQDEADAILKASSDIQALLRKSGKFTDYSGRTFHCTAYEYAYWAKDTHMCRMLERHMDEETKAHLLIQIEKIEEEGLTYQQHGKTLTHSKHFDLTPLIEALEHFVNNFDEWYSAKNWHEIDTAWMAVGKAQREVPAHVAQEYCRKDRSFEPKPSFKEGTFPRSLTFSNYWVTGTKKDSWFPLASASTSGLGFDFALIRGAGRAHVGRPLELVGRGRWSSIDLTAVRHLDEVRSAELTQLRENLSQQGRTMGMSV